MERPERRLLAYPDSPAAWRANGYASAFSTARTRTSLQFSHVTSFPLTIFRGLSDASGMLLSTAPHSGDLCLVPALTTRCLTRELPDRHRLSHSHSSSLQPQPGTCPASAASFGRSPPTSPTQYLVLALNRLSRCYVKGRTPVGLGLLLQPGSFEGFGPVGDVLDPDDPALTEAEDVVEHLLVEAAPRSPCLDR